MALTLKEVVPFLQRACTEAHAMSPDLVGEAARLVKKAGDLEALGLSPAKVLPLNWISEHRPRGQGGSWRATEVLPAFALLAARIGEREVAAARKAVGGSEVDSISAPEAINAIMPSYDTVSTRVPERHFFAKMGDPRVGFQPFRTPSGTRVTFRPGPDQLPHPWRDILTPHWHDGIGIVLFDNRKAGAAGVISINSLGRLTHSRVGDGVWGTSGGTMAKRADKVSFRRVAEDALDKGEAMIDKWGAVDLSLVTGGVQVPTEMGGSKGHFVFDKHNWRAGLNAYAEVVDLLGVQYTGSDEGVNPVSAKLLSEGAPDNIYGDPSMPLGGRFPTDWTARGIEAGAMVLFEKLFGTREVPTLVQGAGGIGFQFAQALIRQGVPVSAIVNATRNPLYAAKRAGLEAPLYRGGRGAQLSRDNPWQALVRLWDRAHGIRTRWGLEEILAEHPEIRFVATNAGTHPLTFGNIATMIEYGVLAAGGSANNQLGLDTEGSPLAAAWILQAAGILHPADFVSNRLGATAVISGMLRLTDAQMERQVELAGTFVGEEYDRAFKQGIPPYVYRLGQVRVAWGQRVAAGKAIGGVRPVS